MEIRVKIEDSANTAALRSLNDWLRGDKYVRENAQPSLEGSSAGRMTSEFEVIQLVLTSGFQLAGLSLALMEWLSRAKAAAPIIITPANGWPTRISPDDVAGGRDDYQLRRALVGAPDPQKSRCVLIGVSQYGNLPELLGVQKNLDELSKVLLDPEVWGIPEDRLEIIAYPRSTTALREAIEKAAQDAPETLLIYFAGHGIPDQQDGLLLALPDSSGKRADQHTARWHELAEIIAHATSRRKIVWLDCCYAGHALPGNGVQPDRIDPSELRVADTPDTYVLAATYGDAMAPGGEECTAFTGELVNVLRHGIEPGRPKEEFISLNSLHIEVRIALRARSLPEPSRDDPGVIGLYPQFHNKLESSSKPVPTPGPPGDTPPAPGILGRPRVRHAIGVGVALVVAALIAYWLIPGPMVSGLDLAKYCSTLAPQGAQNLAVAGDSCVQKVNLDGACVFSYQTYGLKAVFRTPDAYSAECVSSTTSTSYGGISNMTGYCMNSTRVASATATAKNTLYQNTWICQVKINEDVACATQNNRTDLAARTEDNGDLVCYRAHLF